MLIDRILEGLSYRPPGDDETYAVDCIVEHRQGDAVLILLAGWWAGDGQPGSNVVALESSVEVRDDAILLPERPEHHVTSLADADDDAVYRQMRLMQDVKRGTYLSRLLAYAKVHPDYLFNPWIRTILARPTIDTLSMVEEKERGFREIGGITLVDQDNVVVDALVIDEHGSAHALNDRGWLAAFTDSWEDQFKRVSVAEFLNWIGTQDPYGPYRFGQTHVGSRKGTLEDVALRLANR